MVAKYYISLGSKTDSKSILIDAMDTISDIFEIKAISRFLIGPCEALKPNLKFINLGVILESCLSWLEMKDSLKQIENNVKLLDSVDIDLLIQEVNSEVYLISPKSISYTHTLKTLIDLNSTLKVNNQDLAFYLNQKVNLNQFEYCYPIDFKTSSI